MTGDTHDLQSLLVSLDKAGHSLVFAADRKWWGLLMRASKTAGQTSGSNGWMSRY